MQLQNNPIVEFVIDWCSLGRDHTFEVEVTIPASGKSEVELFLPVWTPGSYLIREYSRQVECIELLGKEADSNVKLTKIRKNAWLVAGLENKESIRLRYKLYAREKSVRTNWVEAKFAFIVGAATFLSCRDLMKNVHQVTLKNTPEDLAVECSLPMFKDGNGVRLTANDYDGLVDNPILVGDLSITSFAAGSIPHRLISCGDLRNWDHSVAARDTARIVEKVQEFWKEVPYQSYSFQNLVLGGYGGLEHDDCCVLMSEPSIMLDRSAYVDWLGLVCHEFFHTWNVRRLRPKELQRYDYENEQYLTELWIAEGVTSYFDDLLVYRAGLCTESEYLMRLSKAVNTVMTAPGRNVQSLEESSFDTWIKLYRPDENSNNSRVSYYTKGAIVSWLLDIRLAQLSDFDIRLDDVMRKLWERFRTKGYTEDDFESLVQELVPGEWSEWFDYCIRGVGELRFDEALDFLGLRWKSSEVADCRSASEIACCVPGEANENAKVQTAALGCETKEVGGRLVISRIIRGGAASKSQLQVDDELVAMNDSKITAANLGTVLQRCRPGMQATVHLFRRDRLLSCNLTLDAAMQEWKLESVPDAGDIAISNRKRWLAG